VAADAAPATGVLLPAAVAPPPSALGSSGRGKGKGPARGVGRGRGRGRGRGSRGGMLGGRVSPIPPTPSSTSNWWAAGPSGDAGVAAASRHGGGPAGPASDVGGPSGAPAVASHGDSEGGPTTTGADARATAAAATAASAAADAVAQAAALGGGGGAAGVTFRSILLTALAELGAVPSWLTPMAVRELAVGGGRVTLERLAAAAERAAAARLRVGRGRGGPPMDTLAMETLPPRTDGMRMGPDGMPVRIERRGRKKKSVLLAEAAAAAAAASTNGGGDASAGVGVGGMPAPGVVDGRVAKPVTTSRGGRSTGVTPVRKSRAGKALASDAGGSLHMTGLPPPPPPPPPLLTPGSAAAYHPTPPPPPRPRSRSTGSRVGSAAARRSSIDSGSVAGSTPGAPGGTVEKKPRVVTLGTPWTAEDDSRLQIGIARHGWREWEKIRADCGLGHRTAETMNTYAYTARRRDTDGFYARSWTKWAQAKGRSTEIKPMPESRGASPAVASAAAAVVAAASAADGSLPPPPPQSSGRGKTSRVRGRGVAAVASRGSGAARGRGSIPDGAAAKSGLPSASVSAMAAGATVGDGLKPPPVRSAPAPRKSRGASAATLAAARAARLANVRGSRAASARAAPPPPPPPSSSAVGAPAPGPAPPGLAPPPARRDGAKPPPRRVHRVGGGSPLGPSAAHALAAAAAMSVPVGRGRQSHPPSGGGRGGAGTPSGGGKPSAADGALPPPPPPPPPPPSGEGKTKRAQGRLAAGRELPGGPPPVEANGRGGTHASDDNPTKRRRT